MTGSPQGSEDEASTTASTSSNEGGATKSEAAVGTTSLASAAEATTVGHSATSAANAPEPVATSSSTTTVASSTSSKAVSSNPNTQESDEPQKLVGRKISKNFDGHGRFVGKVSQYNPSSKLFMILYNDGDSEELTYDEVKSLLLKPGRPPGTYRQVGRSGAKTPDNMPRSPQIGGVVHGKFPGKDGHMGQQEPPLDPAIMREFEHFILPTLRNKFGWHVELTKNQERIFLPPGAKLDGKPHVDYFTSVGQVLHYIQRNPQLAQLCLPPKMRMDMGGMPSSAGDDPYSRKRARMPGLGEPDMMMRKKGMKGDGEDDGLEHQTMREPPPHMGVPSGMYPGPHGGMNVMMMHGMHSGGMPGYGPEWSQYGGGYGRPGHVIDEDNDPQTRDKALGGKKLMGRGGMPPEEEERRMRLKNGREEYEGYPPNMMESGGAWNGYHHSQQMYYNGSNAGYPMSQGSASSSSGNMGGAYPPYYGQQGYPRDMSMPAGKDRRDGDSPSQRTRNAASYPEMMPSSMHMGVSRDVPSSSYPSGGYPPQGFDRRGPRMGMQDINQEMTQHRPYPPNMGPGPAQGMHGYQRYPMMGHGPGYAAGSAAGSDMIYPPMNEDSEMAKAAIKKKKKEGEDPPHMLGDPKRIQRTGPRKGNEDDASDEDARPDDARSSHPRASSMMPGQGYDMQMNANMPYEMMGRSAKQATPQGQWSQGPPSSMPGVTSNQRMMGGMGIPPPPMGGNPPSHGMPDGSWNRMESEGMGNPPMGVFNGTPGSLNRPASGPPSGMSVDGKLPPFPGRYPGQGGYPDEEEAKASQSGMYSMGMSRRGPPPSLSRKPDVRMGPGPPGYTPQDRDIMVRFFQYYCPPQVRFVDELLYRYRGREQALFHELFMEFCPHNPGVWDMMEAELRYEYGMSSGTPNHFSSHSPHHHGTPRRKAPSYSARHYPSMTGVCDRPHHAVSVDSDDEQHSNFIEFQREERRFNALDANKYLNEDDDDLHNRPSAIDKGSGRIISPRSAPLSGNDLPLPKALEKRHKPVSMPGSAVHASNSVSNGIEAAPPTMKNSGEKQNSSASTQGNVIREKGGESKRYDESRERPAGKSVHTTAKDESVGDNRSSFVHDSAVAVSVLTNVKRSSTTHRAPDLPNQQNEKVIEPPDVQHSKQISSEKAASSIPHKIASNSVVRLQGCKLSSSASRTDCLRNSKNGHDYFTCTNCYHKYHTQCFGVLSSSGNSYRCTACAARAKRHKDNADKHKRKHLNISEPKEPQRAKARVNSPREDELQPRDDTHKSIAVQVVDMVPHTQQADREKAWPHAHVIKFLKRDLASKEPIGITITSGADGRQTAPLTIVVESRTQNKAPEQCAFPSCRNEARNSSKFCSDACGVLFAEAELVEMLEQETVSGEKANQQSHEAPENDEMPTDKKTGQPLSSEAQSELHELEKMHQETTSLLADAERRRQQLKKKIFGLRSRDQHQPGRSRREASKTELHYSDGYMIKASTGPEISPRAADGGGAIGASSNAAVNEGNEEHENEVSYQEAGGYSSDDSSIIMAALIERDAPKHKDIQSPKLSTLDFMMDCITCGQQLNSLTALGHLERCFHRVNHLQPVSEVRELAIKYQELAVEIERLRLEQSKLWTARKRIKAAASKK